VRQRPSAEIFIVFGFKLIARFQRSPKCKAWRFQKIFQHSSRSVAILARKLQLCHDKAVSSNEVPRMVLGRVNGLAYVEFGGLIKVASPGNLQSWDRPGHTLR
jgi:hypothetical protein